MAGRPRWRVVVAVSFVVCATLPAQKTDTAGLVAVPGYRLRLLGVYDEATGDPLGGVRVSDFLTGKGAITGNGGAVRLAFMPDGGGIVRLQKVGYETQMLPVVISTADTVPLTIVMRRLTELPAVVTKDSIRLHRSAALRAFEERRKGATTGYFITEDQLRKSDGRPLANVLAAYAPGVAIDRKRGNQNLLVRSPQCIDGTHAGPPDVYLDGVPLVGVPLPGMTTGQRRSTGLNGPSTSSGAADLPPIDLSQFDVSDFAAVEWYPSSTLLPIEFNHTSARCGALLLWTRER
ncbi:MAG: hypothetical protein ACREPM_08610 [Gemmatimonadaceae bacterium]